MGVISRKILPACGSLCFCCPELRARSRQPVKRYKKLMVDIYPKSQDELPNDRKIGKLTEYASKNPLRIQKIAISLEQRGYKELRNEKYGTVKVVARAYSRMLVDCRDQMPLFATSVLGMIKALLDQARSDDMRVLGCLTLVDFLQNQTDSTYMHNVDVFLPKLCELSQETGEESRRSPLRAAGLQALASMISFMGRYSQISSALDEAFLNALRNPAQIAPVILDNYETDVVDLGTDGPERRGESSHNWVQEVLRGEGRNAVAVVKGAITKLYSTKEISRFKDPATLNKREMQLPHVWAQICVQNLARLSKEASTVRRVLDPLFHYFDENKHWSPDHGLAMTVLRDIQYFMDKSGNEQLCLPLVARHLDHKAVADEPRTKACIVEVIGGLTRQMRTKSTMAEIVVMGDLLRQLHGSIQSTSKITVASGYMVEDHQALQTAIQECLIELVRKVGDSSQIFEMMASNLENLSGNPTTAKTTLDSLSVLARCVTNSDDQSFAEQMFPEALLQQFLRAMMHEDAETRVRAHRLFALLLLPSPAQPRIDHPESSSMVARTSSVFSSASALFEKLRRESTASQDRDMQNEVWPQIEREDGQSEKTEDIEIESAAPRRSKDDGGAAGSYLSPSRLFGSFKATMDRSLDVSLRRSASQLWRLPKASNPKDVKMSTVRLSGRQAALLLSVLWLQSKLPDNLPANFEAMAHTYTLILMFSRAKTYSHNTINSAFQLALAARKAALDNESQLPPSRRRSLFTLATAMLVFGGRIYSISSIIPVAKAPLTDATRDPHLELLEDLQLKAVSSSTSRVESDYGSNADDQDALKSLSCISFRPDDNAESLVDLIMQNPTASSADSENDVTAEQMLQPFAPEEVEGLEYQLNLEKYFARNSPAEPRDSLSFDEIVAYTSQTLDDDLMSDQSGGELPRLLAHVSVSSLPQNAIGVSQLIERALHTAGQVACVSFSAAPLSYSEMAQQCETSGYGSRRKISTVLRLEADSSSMRLTLPSHESDSQTSTRNNSQDPHFEDMPLVHLGNDSEDPATPLLKRKLLQDVVPFSPASRQNSFPEPWQVFRLPPASPYDNFLKAACH